MTNPELIRETRYDDGSGWFATYKLNGFEYDANYSPRGEITVTPAKPLGQYRTSWRVKGAVRSNCRRVKQAHSERVLADKEFLAAHRELYADLIGAA